MIIERVEDKEQGMSERSERRSLKFLIVFSLLFEAFRNMNKSQGGSLKKHLIFCRIVNEQVFIIIVFDCVDRLVNKLYKNKKK